MPEKREGTKAYAYREVFRVEDGWGYDLSDFVLKRDKEGHYGKTSHGTTFSSFNLYFLVNTIITLSLLSVPSNNGDLVFFEPWRAFEVVDSGIRRPKSKTSIVPLRMADCELIYEKEIAPNVLLHILSALRERIGDAESVKRMLHILSSYAFNVGGNINSHFHALFYKRVCFSSTFITHTFFHTQQ